MDIIPQSCLREWPEFPVAVQPMQPGQVERVDSEYKRKGVVSLFLFTEALSGWRRVSVRERRTAVDWAEEVKVLLEEVYPEAKRVILVCDNLNTHTFASLYKAFPAAQARHLFASGVGVYTQAWQLAEHC